MSEQATLWSYGWLGGVQINWERHCNGSVPANLWRQTDRQDILLGHGKKRSVQAIYGNPSHSYGVSLAVWDHTVLPATHHKRTHPASTPARQAGTRFTDHLRMEG